MTEMGEKYMKDKVKLQIILTILLIPFFVYFVKQLYKTGNTEKICRYFLSQSTWETGSRPAMYRVWTGG